MNHHPDYEFIEQYAAGTLPVAVALCVSAHLSFCAQCRSDVQSLQALGGMLLEELSAVPVADSALLNVFARIDHSAPLAATAASAQAPVDASISTASKDKVSNERIPQALRQLVPNGYDQLQWSRVLPSLRIATLDTGCDDYQVTLHRVSPGGSVATHDHRGQEFTLVLNGSFSDEYGVYSDGDFILRESQQPHRPLAALNEECLCLAVQQGPVRFTGFFWRWLNPFLR